MVKRLLLLLYLFPFFGYSQSVTVGVAGPFNLSTNIFGPTFSTAQFDTAFSRHAFIYPSSVLTGLKHGDTINSLEFYAEVEQAIVGQPELKIFLKMAKKDTFPKGKLNWPKEAYSSGSVMVYNGDPTDIIGYFTGYKNFILSNYFVFDTTGGGKNLEVLFEYKQTRRQASSINWWYENSASVPAFNDMNQGKFVYGSGSKIPDLTTDSNYRKPHIRINFPRYKNNLEIIKTYCLGKSPLLAGVNDSIKVLIRNVGKSSVSGTSVFLRVSGANTFNEEVKIKPIKPYQEQIVTFGKYRPDSSGTDVIRIDLAGDEFNGNNRDTIQRRVNYNVFSHADPFTSNLGGIGFGGSTGDFVAKFFTDTGSFINQVAVDFSSAGRAFRLGIWDDDGTNSMPGTVLFMSDSLISVGGTYILPVLPRVKIGGGFYVGIRQITTTNVSFSFQYEDPVRPDAFFFTAPMGSTNWTPFSPGFPYKFNIQPRIQVGNDVSPLSIKYPIVNDDIEYNVRDSIGPIARITNYGFNDQTTPFDVICRITNLAGQEEYRSVKKITLKAGQTDTVYFDTSYHLYNLGKHKIIVTTKLADDKVQDNDSIVQLFNISIKHDLGADIMYSPEEWAIYEYKKDTMIPTVRINNYGTVSKNNFKVTFRIRDSSKIIHSQTLTRSLGGEQQEIITFGKYVPNTVGDYIAECFTSYKDSIPFNDTIRHNVTFQKSNDVGPKSIDVPLPTAVFAMGGALFSKLVVTNYGLKTQDTAFIVRMKVYSPTGSELFKDSLYTTLGGFSDVQVQFKRFNIPNVFGKYKVFYSTGLITDQEKSNDTLTGFFTVYPNRDLSINKFLLPTKDTVLALESLPIKPSIQIKNFGTSTLTNAGPVYFQIFDKGNLIYQDSAFATGNLSYNSVANITFKKDFTYGVSNFLTARAFTRLSGDLIPKNDTSSTIKFRTTRLYDLEIDTVTNFMNGQEFLYENSIFKPQVVIKNFGSLAYPESFGLVMGLYKNNGHLGFKVVMFDSLKRFGSISHFQDSLIYLNQVGDYILTAAVYGTRDQNHQNDSFSWKFSIRKPFDIALDSLTLTDKYNKCYNNIKYQPKVKVSNRGEKPIVNSLVQFNIYQTTNVFWQNLRVISLDTGESKWIKFDSTLQFDYEGSSKAIAISSFNNDNNRLNDTLKLNFTVEKVSNIQPMEESNFKVYPNPNAGNFMVELDKNYNQGHIYIYNSIGKLIKSVDLSISGNKIPINLDAVSGIYLMKLELGGITYSRKVSIVK